jgi:hypothetical protein
MKVFISWSGDAGQRLGYRLNEWLPSIVPEVEPFLSSEIPGGAAWFSSLATALEGAKFGIICLTPEAQKSPWLAFEAGALWRQTGGTGVVAILAGLATSDIVGPFAQLQAKRFERRDVRSVCDQIAQATGLESKRFQLNFEGIWPALERDVRNDLAGYGITI